MFRSLLDLPELLMRHPIGMGLCLCLDKTRPRQLQLLLRIQRQSHGGAMVAPVTGALVKSLRVDEHRTCSKIRAPVPTINRRFAGDYALPNINYASKVHYSFSAPRHITRAYIPESARQLCLPTLLNSSTQQQIPPQCTSQSSAPSSSALLITEH